MSEDKIVIKTVSRWYGAGSVREPALTFDSLLTAITEVYAQANQIGWETKALDDLTTWIREAREKAITDD